MHQISLQQLSKHITNCIQQWQTENICTWLTLNEINLDYKKLREDGIDGRKIKKMKPMDWINLYGTSKFIGRQIVEWIEEESQEFNEIVQANRHQKGEQREIYQQGKAIYKEYKQQQNYFSKLSTVQQLLLQNGKQKYKYGEQYILHHDIQPIKQKSAPKYQTPLPQLQHKCKSQKYLQQPIIQSNSLLQSEGRVSSESLDGDSAVSIEEEDQYYEQQKSDWKIERVKSEENVRIQMNKNNNGSKLVKQKEIFDNESMNVANLMKRKKQETKAFNEKIKIKNKEFNSKNPKLYQYMNFNFDEEQNISSIGISKRISSAQEISNPNRNIIKIQKPEYIPINQPKPKNGVLPFKIESPHIKFASSQLIPSTPENNSKKFPIFEKKLKFIVQYNYENNQQNVQQNSSQKFYDQIIVNGNAKIGRLRTKQIILMDDSVSRQHAQIIQQITASGQMKYFLKDIGSRFGTFIECKGIQQNIQGRSFLIGDSEIQIITAEIHKQSNNPNNNKNRINFDLKVKIDHQKQLTLANRTYVSIGSSSENHIKIDNKSDNAKIWMEKDKLCIQAVEGKIYLKLKEHELCNIQSYLNPQKKVQVVFGWLKARIQLIQTCIVCGKGPSQCICNSTTASKNN